MKRTINSGKRGKLGKPRKDRKEMRENVLRPASFLGYDHDNLGAYFLEREAYDLAENRFRRAIWLNPFEPAFKQHLAWCLSSQARYAEAIEWAARALEQRPGDPEASRLVELIERQIRDDGASLQESKQDD